MQTNSLRIASLICSFAIAPAIFAQTTFTGIDIGAPALAGNTVVVTAGSAYDLTAGGTDIYDVADQFHFAYRMQTGDFDSKVRIASLSNVNPWTKAGLQARESTAAGSRMVSVHATPASGYEAMRRDPAGTFVTKVDSVNTVTYPNTWVRLTRAGNVFTSYTSTDGATWARLDAVTVALPATVMLGMVACSHDASRTAVAQFRDLGVISTGPISVALTAPPEGSSLSGTVTVSANASGGSGIAGVQFKLDGANLGAEVLTAPYSVPFDTTLTANGAHTLSAVARDTSSATATAASRSVTVANSGFTGIDIGGPALAGNTAVVRADSAYDLTAGGTDIYDVADQFHFAYRMQSGDFDIKVRIASLSNVNPWTKAGLQARESTAAGSRMVSVHATPASGYEAMRRDPAGAFVTKVDSVNTVTYPNTWVRLTRAGNLFTSYTSSDGANWARLDAVTVALPATVMLGMVACSHDATRTAIAQFRDLSVINAAPVTPPPTGCIASPLPASGVAIATFHSMSLYYNPASAPSGNQIFMRYRLATDNPNTAGFTWKQGHPLWYDTRPLHTYRGRGSAVHLQAGIQYIFEVGAGTDYSTAAWAHHIPGPQGDAIEPCPSTWSEAFPVGTVLTPWTGTKTTTSSSFYKGSRSSSSRQHVLLADQSGTASGYTVYDFTGASAVAQTSNTSGWFPVVISGNYIILKGLKTIGGESGIFIDPGFHDIVIESCEITSYGRDSGAALPAGLTGTRGVNEDAGIKFPDSSYGPVLDTKRIVIQRSKIHNPAFGNNPWDGGHPSGPAPITMYPTGGQIVVRYNEAYSTTNGLLGGPPDLNHFHQDGLVMGGDNTLAIGPDIDIYKNIVMHYFDDGLETDGDGTNDRVWKNYFDYGGASAVSTTPTTIGPTYVWRNVYNRARMFVTDVWGNERDRLYMIKSGGMGPGLNGGRRYIYHNTSMQPPYTSESTAGGPNPLGAGFGAGGNGGADAMQNTVSRNNLFEMWKPTWSTFDLGGASGNDLDYDLSNGVMSEVHGYQGTTPRYQTGNGWSSYWNGKYRLQPATSGYDDGVVIPNFNDGYLGVGPDRGAHEDGTPDMDFGTTASGN